MPSLFAQALWPFPAPHLGLAEGHWHSPGSKILGLAQGGLSCSFKLWGSAHRPPIVLGSSLVPTLPSALGSHTSSLSTYWISLGGITLPFSLLHAQWTTMLQCSEPSAPGRVAKLVPWQISRRRHMPGGCRDVPATRILTNCWPRNS